MANHKIDTRSKSKKTKKATGPSLKQRLAAMKNDKNRKVLGAFLVLLSVFAFIAFVSYLFTWQEDQSVVDGLGFWDLMREGQPVDNWLGKLGAFLGHRLIYNSLGFSAFLLVLLFFVAGIRIALGIALLPFPRLLRNCLFLFVFIPLFLGTISHHSYPIAGGKSGFLMVEFLHGMIGKVGTGFLVAFLAFSYLIFAFNPDMKRLRTAIRSMIFVGEGKSNMDPGERLREKIEQAEWDTDDSLTTEDATDQDETVAETDGDDEAHSPENKTEEAPGDREDLEIELSMPEESHIEEKGSDEAGEGENDMEVEVTTETSDEASNKELKKSAEELGDFDPTLDLASYQMPPVELLQDHGAGSGEKHYNEDELVSYKNKIIDTLSNYKIGIDKIKATVGPTVTLYEIIPEAGVRISKIKNLEDDIALSLSALGIRIIAPIPGRGTIGIEVPNSNPAIVSMRALIKSEKFANARMELPVALGKTINNESFVTDLAKMPHLLMAGATGQGKSVGLNAMLVSLLYKKHPSQLKFVLVDPKKVELTLFNKIERHFLAKLPDEEEAIITDTDKVVKTLNSLCKEMDNRYELLKNAHVRNIREYNAKFVKRRLNPEKGHRFLPYIVLVVDEFADLIMTAGKEVELPIARLAQLARAIGIHLIIATQRPSVNIITGVIKANFPARIAFRVTSKVDSRTILDAGGADQLIGRGDMLFSTGNELVRLQCGFVDTPEVEEITEFIGEQRGYPQAELLPEVQDESSSGPGDIDEDRDELFEEAARIVVVHQQGSASLLQRKLKLGYNRAGRIIDQLESAGIIGPFKGSKAREVLVADEIGLEQFLETFNQKSS